MIAISYRREDSMPIAGRLYDRLQAKFGKQNVFMDFDSIPPGVDFRERIRQTIERSNLVIAVIGPNWLGEQSDGSRRIDDPTDFVRLEIDYALKGGIPIIPLLVNSTAMPKPEKLPANIEALAFRNALPLDSGMDFHSHAERLINSIANIRPPSSGKVRSRIAMWSTITIIAVGLVLFLYQRRQRVNEPKQETPAGQSNVTIRNAPETTPTQSPEGVVAVDSNRPVPVETNRDVAPPTTTPPRVESGPAETPVPPQKTQKVFAGAWEGKLEIAGGKNIPHSEKLQPMAFVVNESENEINGETGWVRDGPRTLKKVIAGGAYHSMMINEDGKTGTYSMDFRSAKGPLNTWAINKITAEEANALITANSPAVEATAPGAPNRFNKKLFAGTWEGTLRSHWSDPNLAKITSLNKPVFARLTINEAETEVTWEVPTTFTLRYMHKGVRILSCAQCGGGLSRTITLRKDGKSADYLEKVSGNTTSSGIFRKKD